MNKLLGACLICSGAAQAEPRFIDPNDGTFIDTETNLVWMKSMNCSNVGNSEWAVETVRTLQHGNCGLLDGSQIGDWSLPTIQQLNSLVDYTVNYPAINPEAPFQPKLYSSLLWSSTDYAPDNNKFWSLNIVDGAIKPVDKITSLRVYITAVKPAELTLEPEPVVVEPEPVVVEPEPVVVEPEPVVVVQLGECADGLDNDGDGLADADDPHCKNDIWEHPFRRR